MDYRRGGDAAHTRTHKNEGLQAKFLLIAITALLQFSIVRLTSALSGRGHPTYRNSSAKLYDSGDHDTTLGV
jgi:hypothetical protein